MRFSITNPKGKSSNMLKFYPHLLLTLAALLFTFQSFAQPSQEEMEVLTAAFEQSKGKLHCPTANGSIDRGKLYLESDLKTSGGVDVIASSDSVLAVFEGIVVSAIPAGKLGYSLIVSHGDYFAVYSRITGVFVESKQKVDEGQFLGVAEKGEQSGFIFHFELWKNTDKLFPGDWIKCTD